MGTSLQEWKWPRCRAATVQLPGYVHARRPPPADAGGYSHNLGLVEVCQAAVCSFYCNDGRYPPAERAARQSKLGVWAQPGLQQQPWVWRQH